MRDRRFKDKGKWISIYDADTWEYWYSISVDTGDPYNAYNTGYFEFKHICIWGENEGAD